MGKFKSAMFLLANVCLCESITRNVDYDVIGSKDPSTSHYRVACAESYAANHYMAVRVDDVTGVCEGLDWDWGSGPTYEAGFTYVRKIKTVEIYEPPLQRRLYNWLLPGEFGVGGWIEIAFAQPTGDWSGYRIDLLDTTDLNYNVYDGETEVIMVHIWTRKGLGKVVLKTWLDGWTDEVTVIPMPFEDGVVCRVKIVPLLYDMQILVNDVEIGRYNHPTDPRTAKLLKFIGFSTDSILQINNITFVGI